MSFNVNKTFIGYIPVVFKFRRKTKQNITLTVKLGIFNTVVPTELRKDVLLS